jgi:hypothetical protein
MASLTMPWAPAVPDRGSRRCRGCGDGPRRSRNRACIDLREIPLDMHAAPPACGHQARRREWDKLQPLPICVAGVTAARMKPSSASQVSREYRMFAKPLKWPMLSTSCARTQRTRWPTWMAGKKCRAVNLQSRNCRSRRCRTMNRLPTRS